MDSPEKLRTNRQGLGQIAFCIGCCCGRPDRGYPAVPVDRFKAAWKSEKLNRAIQLTISGCLGPCDLANVALILSPTENIWLGKLETEADYNAILEWVRSSQAAGMLRPLPDRFAGRVFDRFPPAS